MSANVAIARMRLPVALGDDSRVIDLRITGVIREGANVVTPVADCDELHIGDRLIGSYIASGLREGRVRLHVRANPSPCSRPTDMPSSNDAPDGSWELHTTNMRPGGYTLTLQLVDPTSAGCRGSVALDFWLVGRLVGRAPERLEPAAAAPSPRLGSAWKLTSEHDPAPCR
ncbi:MAG TPA: hypothetical protein VK034_29290 [Enhygromyxa sp.]|nr:hypothetical protein [Enhygromyxa sp.]